MRELKRWWHVASCVDSRQEQRTRRHSKRCVWPGCELVRVTIHQPEHLPWPGFFAKLSNADLMVLLDVVQFRKNYFQNRNRVLTSDGLAWVTVPVLSKGHTSRTLRDTRINDTDRRWRQRSWGTIQAAYGRHPFFARYGHELGGVYGEDWEYLTTLNEHVIRLMCSWLGLQQKLIRASDLKVTGSSSDLLLAICKAVDATEYLAGPSASDYLDESMFKAAGIEVSRARFEQVPYEQGGTQAFVGNLSAIDLLFNRGPASLEVISEGSHVD